VQFDFSIQVTLPLKTAGMTGTISSMASFASWQ
jgi:hypothetical protein